MSNARVSIWAVKFNIGILPAVVSPGQDYYEVMDLFTTRNGSWEQLDTEGQVPMWAREAYLKPWGAPDYFDDAGGDRHMFGAIVDPNTGKTTKSGNFRFYNWTDGSGQKVIPVKERSGWANEVTANLYHPDMDGNVETGNRGPWACRPERGIPADTVVGGGMPFNWHVSVFATWVLKKAVVIPPPPMDLEQRVDKLETWALAWSAANPGGPQYVR